MPYLNIPDSNLRLHQRFNDHDPPHVHCSRNREPLGYLNLETLEFKKERKAKVSVVELQKITDFVKANRQKLIEDFYKYRF